MTDIPLELKLVGQSQQVLNDIQNLVNGQHNINLNLGATAQAIRNLQNLIRTGLNDPNAPINLTNLQTTQTTINLLRTQVQDGLNAAPINLTNIQVPQNVLLNIRAQIEAALQNLNITTNVSSSGGGVQAAGTTSIGPNVLFNQSNPTSVFFIPAPPRPAQGPQVSGIGILQEEISNITQNNPSAAGQFYNANRLGNVISFVENNRTGGTKNAIRNRSLVQQLTDAPLRRNLSLASIQSAQLARGEVPAVDVEADLAASIVDPDSVLGVKGQEALRKIGLARQRGTDLEVRRALGLGRQLVTQTRSGAIDPTVFDAQSIQSITGILHQAAQRNDTLGDRARKAIADLTNAERDLFNKIQKDMSQLAKDFTDARHKFDTELLAKDIKSGKSGLLSFQNPVIARLQQEALNQTPEGVAAQKQLLHLHELEAEAQKRLEKAQLQVDQRGRFGNIGAAAEKFNVDPSLLTKRSSFFDLRRVFGAHEEAEEVRKSIGLGALFSTIHGDPIRLLGGTAGGIFGGAVGGTAAASELGSAVGIGVTGAAVSALQRFVGVLLDASKAGLTFQRSILGITAVISQSSTITDTSGRPLSLQEQLRIQKQRATEIQLTARQQAADVGIGGETESSLVQALVTGFGSKGIQLSAEGAAALTSRFGSALNILAPELAGNPAVIRRDIFDIARGTSQAGRTALGSRLPQIVDDLKAAKTEEQVLAATKALDQFIESFKNSGDAITQIQRFNAQLEIIQTTFGGAFVEQLSSGFKALADSLKDPKLVEGLTKLGASLGQFVNSVIKAGAEKLPDTLLGVGKAIEDEGLGAFLLPAPTNQLIHALAQDEDATDRLRTFETASQVAVKRNQKRFGRVPQKGFDVSSTPEARLTRILSGIKQGGSQSEVTTTEELAESSPLVTINRLANVNRDIFQLPEVKALGTLFSTTQLRDQALREAEAKQILRRTSSLPDQILGLREAVEGGTIGARVSNQESLISGLRSRKSFIQEFELPEAKTAEQKIALNDKLVEIDGLLLEAEGKLAAARNDHLSTINNLIDQESKLAELKGQGIDRTTFVGEQEALQADIVRFQNEANRKFKAARDTNLSPGQQEQLRLEGESILAQKLFPAINQQELQPVQQAQELLGLQKTLATTSATVATSKNKFEELSMALGENTEKVRDFGKSLEENRMSGIQKLTALRDKLRERGEIVSTRGLVLPESEEGKKDLETRLLKAEFEREAEKLGPISQFREYQKGRFALENERIGLEEQQQILPYDIQGAVLANQEAAIRLRQRQRSGLGSIEDVLGGSALTAATAMTSSDGVTATSLTQGNPMQSVGDLNKSLTNLVGSLNNLIAALQPTNLASAISSALSQQFPAN